MAVLCEAISVIMKAEALVAAYGSFEAFKKAVPNRTLAADEELVRVGFMLPNDVRNFVAELEATGLRYIADGTARDLVVVDQIRGPAAKCNWLEFGHVTVGSGCVAACRMVGSSSSQLLTPDGWIFEGSLSQTYGFVPRGAEAKSLQFVRHAHDMDVYLNKVTGREVYVGRASKAGPEPR